MNIKTNMKGVFNIKVMAPSEGGGYTCREELEFENLILNSGLESWCAGGTIMNQCVIGTGTNPPQVTDTQLGVPGPSTPASSFSNISPIAPDYVSGVTGTYRFNEGILNGNYTELGVTAISGLFSRTLIKDSLGNPVALTVLSTERLDVSYTLYRTPSLTDQVGSTIIGGVTYNYVTRVSGVNGQAVSTSPNNQTPTFNFYSGSIGTITTAPSTNITGGVAATLPYTPGSFTSNISYTIPLDVGNTAGFIRSMTHTGHGITYQTEFTPTIPKNNTIRITFNAGVIHGRA
jgi:hypothetical protein